MAENEANSVLNTETDPCAEDLEEALCVLRGSDPENCSYSRGYVKRQAVFACNTCTPSAAEPAGICLACANKCHDGHDIFELYTKRNFRCDCGNDKFGDFKCQLSPDKDKENAQNHYNHNFSGLYCTCNQKYPDAENQDQDEMIQCVICEDWFHSRHLGCPVEDPEDLQEMVCEACMNRAPFLWTYAAHFAAHPGIGVRPTEETEVDVDVVRQGDEEDARECSQHEGKGPSNSVDHKSQQQASDGRTLCKRTHEQMTACLGKALSKTEACRLKELQNLPGQERPRQGAVFWPDSWRSELCTCTNCKRSYVAAEVQFLMDESDTMLSYENKGRAEPFGQHPLMLLTSSLDRVQQLEVIYGFNELKSAIGAFVDQHAAEGKVVTVEDVNQLFEELYAKRRKTNAGYQ